MDIQDQIHNTGEKQKNTQAKIKQITSVNDGHSAEELDSLLDTLVFVRGDLRALNEASEMARQAR